MQAQAINGTEMASPIGGATATTLNITTAPANSGSYTVISTVGGCASAVSNAVAVTINALPLTTPVVTPANDYHLQW
jgi:hypothetical protein